ncbi:hypothetical protein SAMN06269185_2899 [Natronoarchaeum philippinense]|uniref:Uncharacterized protein n=1 Tax=Natronoarchaeum philippinense TaxID=558529 RepID=A0A285P7H4_NATPI|nr:hypothetical protein [Natronoarchaeum philippinense]SNZ17153.1 hypothetical protein SAMN06269185_2899 [Natronoarchaeum philippinense]
MSSETDGAGDAGSSSDTYTHDPAAFEANGERRSPERSSGHGPREADERVDGESPDGVVHPADADREFDWRGWLLVGVIFFAFVIAPIVTYLRPPQLPYFPALIAFPLLPALALGIVAVWATTRP